MLAAFDRFVSPGRAGRAIAGDQRRRLDDLWCRDVMRVDVENEGILRELLVASLTLEHLACRNVKKVPEDLVHREKCRGHSAGAREKFTARDAELFARLVGDLIQPMLDALLLDGLIRRLELFVRDDLRRDRQQLFVDLAFLDPTHIFNFRRFAS